MPSCPVHSRFTSCSFDAGRVSLFKKINVAVEISTPETRKLRQEQVSRIAGVNVVLKEDKENAINGKQKDSVREETNVVSGTMKISVRNQHQKPLHPLSHQHKEMVEVRREKETSEARVRLGRPIDSGAGTS